MGQILSSPCEPTYYEGVQVGIRILKVETKKKSKQNLCTQLLSWTKTDLFEAGSSAHSILTYDMSWCRGVHLLPSAMPQRGNFQYIFMGPERLPRLDKPSHRGPVLMREYYKVELWCVLTILSFIVVARSLHTRVLQA